MANVMFYHTGDKHPKILEKCKTKADAQKAMRRYARGQRVDSAVKVKRTANRIEFRRSGYSIAYYVA